jgi:hypothetical protein
MTSIFLLFPVVGVGLVIGGLVYRRQLRLKLEGYMKIDGTVVSHVSGMSGGFDPSAVYRPVVEYFVGGRRFMVTHDAGYGHRKKEGMKAAVMYRPANPSDAFIYEDYYTFANIMLAIGCAFLLLGTFIGYQIL